MAQWLRAQADLAVFSILSLVSDKQNLVLLFVTMEIAKQRQFLSYVALSGFVGQLDTSYRITRGRSLS